MHYIEIKDETYDKIKRVDDYMRISKKEGGRFRSINSIIESVIDFIVDYKGITDKELQPKEIDSKKNMLSYEGRLDNNLSKELKKQLKSVAKGMVKENMINSKPTYNEFLEILLRDYVKSNPQLEKYIHIDEILHIQFQVNKMRDREW
jgi:hypothetical protein